MYSILIPLLPLFIYLILKQLRSSSNKVANNLPPGPYQWPIIGNIPQLIGKNPHIIVTNLSKLHGPLISLKLGTQLLIMGSSPQAATEILKTNDRHLSARYTAKAITPIKEEDLKRFSILWSTECTEEWKSLRAVWRGELFGEESLRLQTMMREKKVDEMVEFLRGSEEGEVVSIGDLVFGTVYNTMGNHCFSSDMVSLGDEGSVKDWKETIWRFMESGTTPVVGDFFPMLGGLDLHAWAQQNTTMKYSKRLFAKWEEIIIKRRKEINIDNNNINNDIMMKKRRGDFLEFMLAHGYSHDKMLHMFLEIFPPACGNITATIEWAMAELIKNKQAMNKLILELQINIPNDSNYSLRESQISQLPYLNACIKETLRLHPPIAFVPHLASSACNVLNYTVPKGSLVMVNLWALGHDPNTWKDPFTFQPERFLDSNLDLGDGYLYLPYGAGRRMCPGIQFADKQVHYIVAALVRYFDWSLPNNEDLSKLDMSEKYGVPVQKEKPLILVPRNK